MKERILSWLINRLKEPSTWKAIFGAGGLGGCWVAPEFLEYIASATGIAIAAVEFIREEKNHETATDTKGN